MKLLWFLAVALCAFRFVKATDADQHNESELQIVEDKNSESKLLNEVDDKGDDEALEDKNNEDEGSIFPELLTEKDVEHFKEPEMQRLARQMKSFHNYNLQRRSNNLDVPEDEEDDVVAEERAIRRRQRVRRRNTKNKIKRINRNRQVADRSKDSRRRMQNKNSDRRRKTKKSKVKNTKKTRRNNNRRSVFERRYGNRRNQKRSNVRSNKVKRKRSNKTRRNNGQHKSRNSENERLTNNPDENVNESDIKLQAPESESESEA